MPPRRRVNLVLFNTPFLWLQINNSNLHFYNLAKLRTITYETYSHKENNATTTKFEVMAILQSLQTNLTNFGWHTLPQIITKFLSFFYSVHYVLLCKFIRDSGLTGRPSRNAQLHKTNVEPFYHFQNATTPFSWPHTKACKLHGNTALPRMFYNFKLLL